MELQITKIHDKASRTANETIEFNVLADLDLRSFAITDNTYDVNKNLSNINPHFYKFPHQLVKKGDKVILHTGKGTDGIRRKLQGVTHDTYDFFCGSDNFIWNDTGDVAKLYKMTLIDRKEIPSKLKKFAPKK